MAGPTSILTQKAGIQLLFFLRFIQLGASTVTGFIYCYLVWQHNNHYCVYYPWSCTDDERSRVNVPWEYKLVLTACTLAFLESYISTASCLHRQQMPTYRSLLLTTTPVAVFIGVACGAILRNPSTSRFCWFLQVPVSLKSDVEEKFCTVVVDGYVSLSITTGFTAFIFLMSAISVIYRSIWGKRIVLPDEPSTAKPGDICGHEGGDLIKV